VDVVVLVGEGVKVNVAVSRLGVEVGPPGVAEGMIRGDAVAITVEVTVGVGVGFHGSSWKAINPTQ